MSAGTLPHSWCLVSMDDLGTWKGGGTPSKSDSSFWTGGHIPWVSPKDMKTDRIFDTEDHITAEAVETSATSVLDPGSVLIVVRSGILQHSLPVAVTQVRVALNQDLKGLIPFQGISPVFVALAIRCFEQEILHSCAKTGTTVQSIEFPRFLRFRIPLAPLSEQHRIVAEIEKQFTRLAAGVAALKRAQANLKRYRASVLKAACEGRLVPTEAELARAEGRDYKPADRLLPRILKERREKWEADQLAKMKAQGKVPKDDKWKEKYQEPTGPDTVDLPELPEGWVWMNLEQMKIFSLYGPRFSSDDYSASGPLVLRTSDISESGKVNLSTAPHLPLTDEEFAKYRVEQGDLLITRTGSLGTLAVFNDTVEAIPGAYLIQYRLAAPLETAWYIFYVFKSPAGQKQLVGGGAGVGRPNLNAPTIEAIPIPLPPLAEQRRTISELERRLSVIDELEAVVAANLKRAERLRQSILKRAFEGKLVPQDPSDEPASVLLERIRAERIVEARPEVGARRAVPLQKRIRAERQVEPKATRKAISKPHRRNKRIQIAETQAELFR